MRYKLLVMSTLLIKHVRLVNCLIHEPVDVTIQTLHMQLSLAWFIFYTSLSFLVLLLQTTIVVITHCGINLTV